MLKSAQCIRNNQFDLTQHVLHLHLHGLMVVCSGSSRKLFAVMENKNAIGECWLVFVK